MPDDLEQTIQLTVPGTAWYTYDSTTSRFHMPVTCRTCDATTGLTVHTHREDTWISCPAGHRTSDWRLSPDAVRMAALAERPQSEVQFVVDPTRSMSPIDELL